MKQQLPRDYIKYGLWRFKHLDKQWKNSFEKQGIEYDSFGFETPSLIQFHTNQTNTLITGKIHLPIHIDELENLLQALPGETSNSNNALIYISRQFEFQLDESGNFSLHHQTTEQIISKFLNQILSTTIKDGELR